MVFFLLEISKAIDTTISSSDRIKISNFFTKYSLFIDSTIHKWNFTNRFCYNLFMREIR